MKYVSAIFCVFGALIIQCVSSDLSWGKTYTLKAVLRIPSADIEEPYQIWSDGDSDSLRIDFYDGLDKFYRLSSPSGKIIFYKIRPESIENNPSRNVCHVFEPTDYIVKVYNKNIYLPTQNFKHVGSEQIENIQTSKWVYELGYSRDRLYFQHKYTMWVKSDDTVNVPVRYEYKLNVDGRDMDYFRHDYTYFDTVKPDPQVFSLPDAVDCSLQTASMHEPVDPLMEFINPTLEDDRVSIVFDSFKIQRNKSYKNIGEHHERKMIFKNNLRLINSVNRQHKSYSLAVNKFADLNYAELSKLNALQVTPMNRDQHEDDDDDTDDENENDIGDSTNTFDWRKFSAISPVKDQTTLCGSCYAFTSAATIESTLYIYAGCRGQVKEVSEQAIVDCTWRGSGSGGNSGCDNGSLYYTLTYIQKFGVPTNDSYGPYLAMEGVCRSKQAGKKFKISGFNKIPKNKKDMQKALVQNGPLALALNGNPRTFLFYSKGVYNDENCANGMDNLSHGVTLIGFGEEAGQEYWILKNSYGTQWGENGYMRIAIENNVCGVMNYVYGVEFKRKNKGNKCFLKNIDALV